MDGGGGLKRDGRNHVGVEGGSDKCMEEGGTRGTIG